VGSVQLVRGDRWGMNNWSRPLEGERYGVGGLETGQGVWRSDGRLEYR